MEHDKPVLFVSHAGGDWQMYCHDSAHDFENKDRMDRELIVVHIGHLLAKDPTLYAVANLPKDMGAERVAVGEAWCMFDDSDDD